MEVNSGGWRLYEIDRSRSGSEYSENTRASNRHISALPQSAANKLGIELRQDEQWETLCIRNLVERTANKTGTTEEQYQPDDHETMFPPKDLIRVEIYGKSNGEVSHLKEDPPPFDERNRRLWIESFVGS